MGPRRTLATTAALALAFLTVTTGVAVAGDSGHRHTGGHDRPAAAADGPGGATGRQHRSEEGVPGPVTGLQAGVHEQDRHAQAQSRGRGGVESTGVGFGAAPDTGAPSPATSDAHAGSTIAPDHTFGEATTSGAGALSAPVGAPAAAASGPAPDAAAAAPVSGGVTDAYVVVGGATDAPGGAVPAPDVAPVAAPAPSAASGLDGLGAAPALGPIGAVAGQVPEGSSTARALLDAGTGRSLRVIGALLAVIVLFLAVHRRTDKGDRKLAATRSGPEVARFR